MAAVNASDPTGFSEATTMLEHIDRVTSWLPRREAARQDLFRAVQQMRQHLASEPLSRGEILNLQVHVLRLQRSRFRTLLNRRVSELGAVCGHNVSHHPHSSPRPAGNHSAA